MNLINLDKIAFERLAQEKLDEFNAGILQNQANAGWLTESERARLQEIFSNAFRKYNVGLTDQLQYLDAPVLLSIEDARQIAMHQLDADLELRKSKAKERTNIMIERQQKRISRINTQFAERVARLNTDAGRRGLLSSTSVITQMERAQNARDEAIAACDAEISFLEIRLELDVQRLSFGHDQRVEILAKRIHNESQRNAVMVVRERATQLARNYSNWKLWQRTRAELNLDNQARIGVENEIFYEYKAFLLGQDSLRAYQLVTSDPLFFHNLTQAQWVRMAQIMQDRR